MKTRAENNNSLYYVCPSARDLLGWTLSWMLFVQIDSHTASFLAIIGRCLNGVKQKEREPNHSAFD